jgi:hypothetical protein
MQEAIQKNMNNYLRYQTQQERLFQRALHDLLKLRAEKRKEQIGFESQKRARRNKAANKPVKCARPMSTN